MTKVKVIFLILLCTSCSFGSYYEIVRSSKHVSETIFQDDTLCVTFVSLNPSSIQLMFLPKSKHEGLDLDIKNIRMELSFDEEVAVPTTSTFKSGKIYIERGRSLSFVEKYNLNTLPDKLFIKLRLDLQAADTEINEIFEIELSKENYGLWGALQGI